MLFSHPRMVEDLIDAFVKEDFVSEFDFSYLKRANNSYVTEEFKDREADILWETKFKGKDAYIYILIEFQSTVDKFMSLRMLTYILLFYQDILKKKKPSKLPVVFPILLYNGEKRWNAPEKLEDLIEIPYSSIKPYIPKFKYYKIAENEFKKESLEKLDNLAAQLFNIENSSIGQLDEAVAKILQILKHEVPQELQRDFGLWLRGLLRIKENDFDLSKIDDMEVKPMLAETIKKFEEECILKGKRQGKLEGKLELAKRMLKLGVKAEIIAKASGLEVSEVNKLLN